ncbi:MAG: NAD(P) transhydrogenase subunit alpha [Rickettsiaceae bacterium]|nr:MAG: NAD(P) transhydrogenase subunit alpha [Rickettsiaceae bacterium]
MSTTTTKHILDRPEINESLSTETYVTLSDQPNIIIDPFIYAMTIFVLACFVGYYVVWKVTPALHTPLMALTNAISGIIIIGSMLAAGFIEFSLSSLLGYFATFLAATNIFGGFIVTERMLKMFKKK